MAVCPRLRPPVRHTGGEMGTPDRACRKDVTPVGAVPASLLRSVGQMAASPPSPPFRLLRPTREQALWPFEEQPRRRTLYGTTHLAWMFPPTRRLNLSGTDPPSKTPAFRPSGWLGTTRPTSGGPARLSQFVHPAPTSRNAISQARLERAVVTPLNLPQKPQDFHRV